MNLDLQVEKHWAKETWLACRHTGGWLALVVIHVKDYPGTGVE